MDEFDFSDYFAGQDAQDALPTFDTEFGTQGVGIDSLQQAIDASSLDDILASLEGIGTDLGPASSMGMDKYLLEDLGLGSLSDSTGGYYDEISGKFLPSAYGNLQAPLDDTSGANLESMKDYTYDQKTGTWTTPDGQVYTPAIVPSNQVKSGAQVMVDAGALPPGYAGLQPGQNSTAGGNADKYTYNVGPGGKSLLDKTSVIDKDKVDAGIKGGTTQTPGGPVKTGTQQQQSGMNPMMMMALMYLLSQMGKDSGSKQPAVIPQLQASRSQLPYSSQARPGAGGRTYFTPTEYKAAGGEIVMAGGGLSSLGSYSDGGRLLKGPGDGVSDGIPATIAGKQPARLADGEFVVPARIVSELGNGSTDAGAKRLYEMMDRVQKARRKTKNVAADTKAHKYLPA